jgi:hypothetical protein
MSSGKPEMNLMFGAVGACWGILGLSLLFGSALYRLYPYALELFGFPFEWHHWLALAFSLAFMGYAEGYRGFHRRFSPRAAARALYLRNHPTPARVLLAPLFCMGFFHAVRRRKISAYGITAMVVVLVILVRSIPQPWRGIIDAGVLLGLGWGLLSVWIYSLSAFFGPDYLVSPETPEG